MVEFQNLEITYKIRDNIIYSVDPGCGCCGDEVAISKTKALEEIEEAIKELRAFKEKLEQIEDSDE